MYEILILIFIIVLIILWNYHVKSFRVIKGELNKNILLFNFTTEWLLKGINEKRVSSYFSDKSISTIAVYGMGGLGKCFLRAVSDSNVKVVCLIDRNRYGSENGIPYVKCDDNMINDVDAIVVTAIYDFEAIKNSVNDSLAEKMISLESIIYSI